MRNWKKVLSVTAAAAVAATAAMPTAVFAEGDESFKICLLYTSLWIARINAAARMNGLSYSKMMHGLKVANIDINRKMLAELAVNDAEGFKALAEIAKKAIA